MHTWHCSLSKYKPYYNCIESGMENWESSQESFFFPFLDFVQYRQCAILSMHISYTLFLLGFFLVTNMYGCLFDNKIIIIIQIKYPHFNCSLTRWIYLLYSTYQNLHTFLCTFCNYQKQHPLVLTVSLNWLFINVRTHKQTNKQTHTNLYWWLFINDLY